MLDFAIKRFKMNRLIFILAFTLSVADLSFASTSTLVCDYSKYSDWVMKPKKQNIQAPRRAVVPIGDEKPMRKSKAIASVVKKIKY